MNQRVVVTGGAGFVGSHLCEALIEEGYQVVCVDSFISGDIRNIASLVDLPAFELVEADVSDRIPVAGDVNAVLHFASPASPPDYLRYPIQTMRAGSAGTLNALELARRRSARLLLASTSETYGEPQVHPQHEDYWGNVNPVGPRSVYDEAKRFAEAATMAYRRTYGTDTGVIRIFNTFGPRMRSTDGRAVPTFVSEALAGRPIPVTGDGRQTRSLCYIDDLVDAVLRMLRSDLAGPINLGNPDEISMLELARWIRDLVHSDSEIIFTTRPENDPVKRRPEISQARQRLGWEPKTSCEEGLKRTIEWFRSQAAAL